MAEKIQLIIEVDDKGSIKVKQFADESKKAFKEITDGTKQTQGSLDNLRDSWIGLTAKIAAATAAIYAAKKIFYDLPKEIASQTNEIEKQASVLGISTDELQKWQYAAKMSDVNAQELAIGIKMLSRNMEDASTGAGDAAKYFSAMGISVKDSSGNLQPLNQIMMQIADKFASWESGPRKIAIAMQLFGRSGEAIIPILDKGRGGIEAYWKEAERLGFIIDENIIKKGNEAEEIFKKLSMQWQNFKLNLGPAALEFAKFLDQILPTAETIKIIFEEINQTIINSRKLLEGLGILSPKVEAERKIIDIRGPKIGPPIVAEKGLTDIQKQIIAGEQEFNQMRIEAWAAVYTVQAAEDEEWVKAHENALERIKEGEEEFRKVTQEAWESYNQYLKDISVETSIIGETLAQNMASAWNFNIKNIITDSKNLGDALKNVFKGMADAFTSAVSKMISDWILFSNLTGKYKSGTGLIGLIASIFGLKEGGIVVGWRPLQWIPRFQQGGIIDRPTLGMIGEGGEREWIIPESKIGKERNQEIRDVHFHINAVDAPSFIELCRRNPQGILSALVDDNRIAGVTRYLK